MSRRPRILQPRSRTSLVFVAFVCGACSTPPPPADAGRLAPAKAPDKAALYGSALMVPSRAGERARHELALAGEIERLWRDDPRVVALRVTVSDEPTPHEDSKASTNRVVVVGQHRRELSAAERTELAQELARSIGAIAGDLAPQISLIAQAQPPSSAGSTPAFGPILAAILWGAGLFFGVALERWRLQRLLRQQKRTV